MIQLIFLLLAIISIIWCYRKAKKGIVNVYYNSWDVFGSLIFGILTLFVVGGIIYGIGYQIITKEPLTIFQTIRMIVFFPLFIIIVNLYNFYLAKKINENKNLTKFQLTMVILGRIFSGIAIILCCWGFLDSLFRKREEGGPDNFITRIALITFFALGFKKLTETLITNKK